MMRFWFSICVWCLSVPIAIAAAPDVRLTSGGLGTAQFGMSLQEVEKVLGVAMQLAPAQLTRWQAAQCTVQTPAMPGVQFVFDKGRFAAVRLGKGATIATRSGLSVGQPEQRAIEALKADPTYSRFENRYDDGSGSNMEIVVGKFSIDQGSRTYRGNAVRISSVKGRIAGITAGAASYVMIDEHLGGDC